ncbi:hypothetical protein BFN02_07970 [Staphylococcus equorum]|nr:hypothetical protein BFN02_07970 [Staphylococcus equorum]
MIFIKLVITHIYAHLFERMDYANTHCYLLFFLRKNHRGLGGFIHQQAGYLGTKWLAFPLLAKPL